MTGRVRRLEPEIQDLPRKKVRIVIDKELREVRGIYSDELGRMLENAGFVVRPERASHVEPDGTGHWIADMSLVNGPVLGPFDTRKEALSKEVEFLKENCNF